MERFQEEEMFYREIALKCGEGLLAIDEERKIVFANKGAEHITGYSIDELINMSFDQIISRNEIEEIIDKRSIKEDINRFHHFVTPEDGIKRCLSFHISPYEDGAVVSFRDMTRFHETERSIRIDQEKVEKEEVKEMIGTNPVMMELFSTIRKVATADLPLLILGESGTGKELTVKAIHERSARKDGPFVAINCGAIPEGLLESELFGYEKGAFTGAYTQKKGKIEDANGGILFLDEIGEMSSPLQVKLLRFLEDHRINRLGGRNEIAVDVRIIAATNADMKTAVSIGAFREDLYYRLSGLTISLPPLRERGDDAIVMAKAFLKKYEKDNNKVQIRGFTHEALEAIKMYQWPGNIRELVNKIRRAIVMTEDGWITTEGLGLKGFEVLAEPRTLAEYRDILEKDTIIKTLNKYNWNISRACKELGISRPHMYALIKKFNLSNKFTP